MLNIVGIAGALLAAGATAAACSSSGSSGPITSPQTLTFKTTLKTLTRVPVAYQTSSGPVPGDSTVITDDYMKDGKVVGTDDVQCVLITLKSALCTVAVKFSNGGITLQGMGPADGSGTFNVAITGGTGVYEGARGQATISSGKGNTGTETFHLIP